MADIGKIMCWIATFGRRLDGAPLLLCGIALGFVIFILPEPIVPEILGMVSDSDIIRYNSPVVRRNMPERRNHAEIYYNSVHKKLSSYDALLDISFTEFIAYKRYLLLTILALLIFYVLGVQIFFGFYGITLVSRSRDPRCRLMEALLLLYGIAMLSFVFVSINWLYPFYLQSYYKDNYTVPNHSSIRKDIAEHSYSVEEKLTRYYVFFKEESEDLESRSDPHYLTLHALLSDKRHALVADTRHAFLLLLAVHVSIAGAQIFLGFKSIALVARSCVRRRRA